MAAKKISMDRLRGVMNMGREADQSMGEHLHLSVLVDPESAMWLVHAIRDALVPERDAVVDVSALGGTLSVAGIDVGVVISGGSDDLVRNAIRYFAGARQHVIVVAQSSLDVPETNLPAKLGQYVQEAVSSEHGPLLERFANALLDSTEKDVSCAANFSFCRDVATARLVSRCAARNAFMGIADFIPGAGMPLMTMNQVNLSFDIAATHGRGLGIGRVPEVLSVISAGFAYRWASRLLLNVFPGLSLLIRCGLAYGGTLVTGRMLSSHFTETLPSQEPAVTVKAQVSVPDEPEAVDAPESKATRRRSLRRKAAAKEEPFQRSYITIGAGGVVA